MKNFCLILALILASVLRASCQIDLPGLEKGILPPSPTAAELGRYGEIPVGMYNGAATYSIPLFELKGKNLSLPISLSYTSNGVKIDQIASWVGMSWSLNAGGVITRSILDEPDESNHDTTPENFGDWDGFELGYYLEGTEDTEPDVYAFNFMGYSGKFVQSKVDFKFYTIPYENFKIKKTSYPEGDGFKITTGDGVEYYFDAKEISKEENQCMDDSHNVFRITAWFLTKVVHPTGEEIELKYRGAGQFYYSGVFESHTTKTLNSCSTCPEYPQKPSGCLKMIYTSTFYLDSIYNNTTAIKFYSTNDRLDVLDQKLDSIVVVDRSSESKIRKFSFKYVYANRDVPPSGAPYHIKHTYYRMFLKEVQELGSSISKEPYRFEYIDMNTLPKRLSYAQDHWGYFNNASNAYLTPLTENDNINLPVYGTMSDHFPELLNVDRDAHFPYTQAGMLNKIIFPTGGSTFIEYESNSSSLFSEGGGVRVKRITSSEVPGKAIVERYYYDQGISDRPKYLTYSFGLCEGDPGPGDISCIYPTLSSYSCRNIYRHAGNAVTYRKVTKSFGENFENGGEEYNYVWASGDDVGDLILGWHGPDEAKYNASYVENAPYTNYSWNAGQLLKKITFNKDHVPIQEETYEYNGKQGSPRAGFIGSEDLRNGKDVVAYHVRKRFDWLGFVEPASLLCDATDVSQPEHPCYQKNTGESAFYTPDFMLFDVVQYDIISRWQYLRSKTVKQFNNGVNSTIATTNYAYNNVLHAQLSCEVTLDSKGDTLKTWYYYPHDYNSAENIETLITKNIINKPLDTRAYRGTKLISGLQTKYNDWGQPIEVFNAEIDGVQADIPVNKNTPYTFVLRMNMQYDATSKSLISAKEVNGNVTSFIWSYKGSLPIAKVENATYESISTAASSIAPNFLNDLNNETNQGKIDSDISLLRSTIKTVLPNAVLTTLTHYPQVGIRSSIDANESATYFEYDGLGRLSTVKDKDLNILSAYRYHYIPPSLLPKLEISSSSLGFNYPASSQTFQIDSHGAWSISVNQGWIHPSVTSGSGNATINVSVDENLAYTWRNGTITIKDQSGNHLPDRTVSVSQNAHPNFVTISHNSMSFIHTAESKTFQITSNVSWDVTSNQSWASITPGSGTGNGTVTVTAAQNTAFASRTATLTIRDLSGNNSPDQFITITQQGVPSYMNINPAELHFAAAGETKTFQISANVSWSVTDNESWISITPASGNGNGTISVTATQNTATTSRNGVISISDQSGGGNFQQLLVTQPGTSDYITVSPTGFYLNSSNVDVQFDIFSNLTSWNTRINYISGSGWLDDIYPASGMGNRNDVDIHVNQLPPSGQTWHAEIEVYNASVGISAKLFVYVTN